MKSLSHACQVTSIHPLSEATFQIKLQVEAGTFLNYQAGQYLQLNLDLDGNGQVQTFFYSIANRNDQKRPGRLELIIQNTSELTDKILKRLSEHYKSHAEISVTLPMGQAFLQTNLNSKHLLVAAGSGIAKIKCLTEEILTQGRCTKVDIYWSNRHIDDFYLLEQFQAWGETHEHVSFTPILESSDKHWTGRVGFIYQVIEEDQKNLNDTQSYLCGSPQMVYGTIDKLAARGLREENCFSDVFEYAPREQKMAI